MNYGMKGKLYRISTMLTYMVPLKRLVQDRLQQIDTKHCNASRSLHPQS